MYVNSIYECLELVVHRLKGATIHAYSTQSVSRYNKVFVGHTKYVNVHKPRNTDVYASKSSYERPKHKMFFLNNSFITKPSNTPQSWLSFKMKLEHIWTEARHRRTGMCHRVENTYSIKEIHTYYIMSLWKKYDIILNVPSETIMRYLQITQYFVATYLSEIAN